MLVGEEPTVTYCGTSLFVSDHCLIKVELDIKRNEIEKRLVTTRNFKNFDQADFNSDLVFQWNDKNTFKMN